MPWEETNDYVRSGHEDPNKYDEDSMRTIEIDEKEGIKAVIGCPKGNFKTGKCAVGTQVQSYLFAKEKGWTMTEAKEWFDKSNKARTAKRQNLSEKSKNTFKL